MLPKAQDPQVIGPTGTFRRFMTVVCDGCLLRVPRRGRVGWQDVSMDSIPADDLIWTGSYTADSGGSGAGIGAVAAAADGTLHWLGVAAAADSPSFLAVHPTLPVVYAVAEHARTVRAYSRAGAFGLEPAGSAWPAGDAACHVAVEPSGRFLVVCCWGDGDVLFYKLDADGGIMDRTAAADRATPTVTFATATPPNDKSGPAARMPRSCWPTAG